MNDYVVIWQDPENRSWHPVGVLVKGESRYAFFYTHGARTSQRFVPFGNMTDLDAAYISDTLFPIFANRMVSPKRPEFARYAKWAGFSDPHKADPLVMMGVMGGSRATDTLQVFPVPRRGSHFEITFFSHGAKYLPASVKVEDLKGREGARLFPMWDFQNPYDINALSLRTADPPLMIGYCPRHLATDLRELASLSQLRLTLTQVNVDAPAAYAFLCSAAAPWPEGFSPCSQSEYTPLSPNLVETARSRI